MDIDQARMGFAILRTSRLLDKSGCVTKKIPQVTFDKKNGLYFKQSAVRAVNDTFGSPAPYVRVCFNAETKQISIEPVADRDQDTRAFMSGKENQKNLIIRWADDALMEVVEEMLPDKSVDRVVIPMRYDEDAKWHVIEVGEAVPSVRKRSSFKEKRSFTP